MFPERAFFLDIDEIFNCKKKKNVKIMIELCVSYALKYFSFQSLHRLICAVKMLSGVSSSVWIPLSRPSLEELPPTAHVHTAVHNRVVSFHSNLHNSGLSFKRKISIIFLFSSLLFFFSQPLAERAETAQLPCNFHRLRNGAWFVQFLHPRHSPESLFPGNI
jgi:hypothetical protein